MQLVQAVLANLFRTWHVSVEWIVTTPWQRTRATRCSFLAIAVGLWGLCGCSESSSPFVKESIAVTSLPKTSSHESIAAQVTTFCGACHATPPANSFPRAAWPKEVARGFDFYHESGRTDLVEPDQQKVVEYYQSLAPVSLAVDVPVEAVEKGSKRLKFRQQHSPKPTIDAPAVSFLSWTKTSASAKPALLFTDMRSGDLRKIDFSKPAPTTTRLLSAKSLSHVESCDLDGDGKLELVCAELGSISSGDHRNGVVISARPLFGRDEWPSTLLLSGLGRVADVRPADFDQDGDSDLLVAEFGHLRTGSIFVLENAGLRDSVPEFKRHEIDSRHGTIHVPTADLNGDGRLDFIALISQEYESVVAFLQVDAWKFESHEIFRAPDPAYGSSSIEISDLDSDGDRDVIYTNGDTFGSDDLKPYHAIHWLENQGSYPFVDHKLAGMVGVQIARPADLDGDGDVDVIAGALMPRHLGRLPELAKHDSVLWLEQTSRGRFVRHSLERGDFAHAAICPADLDDDGDLDVAIGNLQDDGEAIRPWLTVWWNLARDPLQPNGSTDQ